MNLSRPGKLNAAQQQTPHVHDAAFNVGCEGEGAVDDGGVGVVGDPGSRQGIDRKGTVPGTRLVIAVAAKVRP